MINSLSKSLDELENVLVEWLTEFISNPGDKAQNFLLDTEFNILSPEFPSGYHVLEIYELLKHQFLLHVNIEPQLPIISGGKIFGR